MGQSICGETSYFRNKGRHVSEPVQANSRIRKEDFLMYDQSVQVADADKSIDNLFVIRNLRDKSENIIFKRKVINEGMTDGSMQVVFEGITHELPRDFTVRVQCFPTYMLAE